MIKIIGNKILKNNIIFDFEDIFTHNFFKYANKISHKYFNNTFYVNEIYNSFIMPYLALKYYIKNEKKTDIDFSEADSLLKALSCDLTSNHINVKIKRNVFCQNKIIEQITSVFLLFASTIYLMFKMIKIPYRVVEIQNKTFSIIRTKSGKSKMRNFDIAIEFEDFNIKDSIYRLFPVRKRLKWVWLSFLRSFNELAIIRCITNNYIGNNTSMLVQRYYCKRVVHTLLYSYIVNYYFSQNSNSTFYTSNNLDRFSVIEEVLAKKYNITSICIPHGLEYGFKFPKGFSCDIHYTNTLYAETFLNNLYNTEKFVFDKCVAEKMFKIENIKQNSQSKVVFFTEPREVFVNQKIIEDLIPLLAKKNIKLFLKLHPKDKLSDYSKYKVSFISNLDEAIAGNICVSRKSTILLEATYNNSFAASILINSKDESLFFTFPSLQSERIKVTKSTSELFNWIIQKYNTKT